MEKTVKKTLKINKGGDVFTVEIRVTKSILKNELWADGPTGVFEKTIVDDSSVTILKNGNKIAEDCSVSTQIGDKMKKLGVIAVVGHANLTGAFKPVIDAWDVANSEAIDFPDAQEILRIESKIDENSKQFQLQPSGCCPRCGTWCYGDCAV